MSIPAGWYPDPAEPEIKKYWDGEEWINEQATAKAEPAPPTKAAPPNEPESPKPPVDLAGLKDRLASPGARLAARIIDLGIVIGIAAVANAWFFLQFVDEAAPAAGVASRGYKSGDFSAVTLSHRAEVLALIMTFTTIALWLAYEVPALVGKGQTVGKRMVGIRVTQLDGNPLRLRDALLRWGVMGIPMLFPLGCATAWLAFDGVWCLTDRKARQCLHDKAARTVVVKQ